MATGTRAFTLATRPIVPLDPNIDPNLDSATSSTSIMSLSSTPAPLKAPLRNRRRPTIWQDKVKGKTQHTRSRETYEPIDKVLDSLKEIKQLRRPHLVVALELLQKEYKSRLSCTYIDIALDFLENKTYAVYFINIEAGYNRDY
jgi:hypothetical protein